MVAVVKLVPSFFALLDRRRRGGATAVVEWWLRGGGGSVKMTVAAAAALLSLTHSVVHSAQLRKLSGSFRLFFSTTFGTREKSWHCQ